MENEAVFQAWPDDYFPFVTVEYDNYPKKRKIG
jgi:hypothetical protein